jgi:hypothetical protein
MTSRTNRQFRECYSKLPRDVQQQAREAYKRFRDNPSHPSLRFKRVHAKLPVYSARINVDHRALGVLRGESIIWFWIGSHAEYEKQLAGI